MNIIKNLKYKIQLFLLVGYPLKIPALLLNKKLISRVTSSSNKSVSEIQWDLIKNQYPFQNKTVVDIGCKRGFFCFKLANKFPTARITGIDVSDIPVHERYAKEKKYKKI